jgi:hypothetical protein
LLIAFVIGALVFGLSDPAGSLGQDEAASDGGTLETDATATAIHLAPAVMEEPADIDAGDVDGSGGSVAVAAADGGGANAGNAISVGDAAGAGLAGEPISAVPALGTGNEGAVEAAVSEPEGEGPELAPPDPVSPVALTESVVVPPPGSEGDVIPESVPAPPANVTPRGVQAPVAPASGQSAVIAQGLVDVGFEEVVWRTVRYSVDALDEPIAVARPIGFVVALDGPLLLVDQGSAERTLLNPGDGAFVRGGVEQLRTSSSNARVQYLSIEMVAASTAHHDGNGEVLHVSEPFVPSPGRHALVLARHALPPDRVLTVPDTGERNLLVVIEGAVTARDPDGRTAATLAASESTVFRGTWEIARADAESTASESAQDATIVIASLGAA